MVEDTHDGEFLAPPPYGSHVRPTAGPLCVGPFTYELSEQSVRVREAADAAIRSVVERSGLGRFMKLTFRGASASHPLGGCRMAASKDLGVVDHRNEVFGNEGLFCIDSSAIPTSLGVNPSLTISAVSERGGRAADRPCGRLRPARQAGRLCPGRAGRDPGPAHDARAQLVGRSDRREGQKLRVTCMTGRRSLRAQERDGPPCAARPAPRFV